MGNQLSRRLDIEGVDLQGVLWGLEFLAAVNWRRRRGEGRDRGEGRAAKVGERVVVIGGGNVAIDVALTALRTGAKSVDMVCLEQEAEMPAFKEGVEQAAGRGGADSRRLGTQAGAGRRRASRQGWS